MVDSAVLIGLAAFIGSGVISVIVFRLSNKLIQEKISEIEKKESELRSYIDIIIKARTRDNKEILGRLEKLQERVDTLEIPEENLRILHKEKIRSWKTR